MIHHLVFADAVKVICHSPERELLIHKQVSIVIIDLDSSMETGSNIDHYSQKRFGYPISDRLSCYQLSRPSSRINRNLVKPVPF